MRSLALARYRFITNVRAAGWAFGNSILLAMMLALPAA